MTVSDADLVGRARAGDLTAYAELIGRHRASLERYAVQMLGTVEDAEDALQDALLRAYRAIGQCTQPERFRACCSPSWPTAAAPGSHGGSR